MDSLVDRVLLLATLDAHGVDVWFNGRRGGWFAAHRSYGSLVGPVGSAFEAGSMGLAAKLEEDRAREPSTAAA